MKLTKSVIDKLPCPDSGQTFYRDEVLMGFAVRVTPSGVKSFIVEKRINGKVRRKTLGRYGALTPEQARKEAQKFLGKVATGIDPIAEVREREAASVTLNEVFETYLAIRASLKPKTLEDYRCHMRTSFKDWQNRPLSNITRDAVAKRHKRLGEKSPARANGAMRVLRALFNFAAGQYEDAKGRSLFPENPVGRLSQTRAWYPNKRKQTVLKPHQLPDWYAAVAELGNFARPLPGTVPEHGGDSAILGAGTVPEQGDKGSGPLSRTIADFLLLQLFTGMRKNEGIGLRWDDIDLQERTLLVEETKNGERLLLPLTDFLVELLQRRHDKATSEYVFPSKGDQGHLIDPRKQMAKIIEKSGVVFTLHDLRRTFITVAESLDISPYTIKRLVNHKLPNDVTAGYIISDIERLRKPMQRVTDFLIRAIGLKENVVVMHFPHHQEEIAVNL